MERVWFCVAFAVILKEWYAAGSTWLISAIWVLLSESSQWRRIEQHYLSSYEDSTIVLAWSGQGCVGKESWRMSPYGPPVPFTSVLTPISFAIFGKCIFARCALQNHTLYLMTSRRNLQAVQPIRKNQWTLCATVAPRRFYCIISPQISTDLVDPECQSQHWYRGGWSVNRLLKMKWAGPRFILLFTTFLYKGKIRARYDIIMKKGEKRRYTKVHSIRRMKASRSSIHQSLRSFWKQGKESVQVGRNIARILDLYQA